MKQASLLLVLSTVALSGCLMNWSALEPDGSASAGAAGAGGGASGSAGALGGKAGASGVTGGGAGGAKAGAAGVGGAASAGKGGAGGVAGGAAGAGAGGAAGGAAGAGTGGAPQAGSAGAAGDPGAGGAAGAGGDAAGGAAGAGGDPAGGAAGAGGDPAGGAAGAGGDPAGGAAGAAGSAGAACNEPNGQSNPANGHCYFLLGGGPRMWTSARDACANAGAHLVTITSQAEQDFVAGMNLNQTTCWIGLSGPTGSLGWVGGETSTFTAWAPNQPNGSGNVCVRIDSQAKLWNDDQCNKSNGALCERD